MQKLKILMYFIILVLSITTITLGVELSKARDQLKKASSTPTPTPSPSPITLPVVNHYVPTGFKILQVDKDLPANDLDIDLDNTTLDNAIDPAKYPSQSKGFVFFVKDTSPVLTKTTIGHAIYKNGFLFPNPGPSGSNIFVFRKSKADATKFEYLAQTDSYQNDRGPQLSMSLANAMTVVGQYDFLTGFVFVASNLPLTPTTQGSVYMKTFVDTYDHDMIRTFVIVPNDYVAPTINWLPFTS